MHDYYTRRASAYHGPFSRAAIVAASTTAEGGSPPTLLRPTDQYNSLSPVVLSNDGVAHRASNSDVLRRDAREVADDHGVRRRPRRRARPLVLAEFFGREALRSIKGLAERLALLP